MATFVVERNLPFAVMDHLSDLVKETFPDSNIASKFKSKHTKTCSIIKMFAKRSHFSFKCSKSEKLFNNEKTRSLTYALQWDNLD